MHSFSIRALSALLALAMAMNPIALGAASHAPSIVEYDRDLCSFAQRFILNVDTLSDDLPFDLNILSGSGQGFHNIQMHVEAESPTVTIATTQGTARIDNQELAIYVACKMVNRDRVNDVLELILDGLDRSCGDINANTYQKALDSLSEQERGVFETKGKPLRFVDDYIASSGGEWLPSAVDDYISNVDATEDQPGYLEIQSPSVRVPWQTQDGEFFHGTHHCKLITAAAMRHWMVEGGLKDAARLFPPIKAPCDAPSSMTSLVGSCHFYFGPSETMFCTDYSGSEWTNASARAECGKRHASREAVMAAGGRYEGTGGLFSDAACNQRPDVGPLNGTCVFNCKAVDETLWHTLMTPRSDAPDTASNDAAPNRGCDLYIGP